MLELSFKGNEDRGVCRDRMEAYKKIDILIGICIYKKAA